MIELAIAEAVKQVLTPEFEAILARLNALENHDASRGKNVMDIDALCEYIKKKPPAIYRLTGQGRIPHSKRGKRLYFDKSEIDEWLLANGVSSDKLEEKVAQYELNKKGRRTPAHKNFKN